MMQKTHLGLARVNHNNCVQKSVQITHKSTETAFEYVHAYVRPNSLRAIFAMKLNVTCPQRQCCVP